MSFITKIVEEKIGPIAMKIAGWKYIQVIRNAFYSTIAFVIVGSIAALIVRAPIDSTTLDTGIAKSIMRGWEVLKELFYVPFRAIYLYTVGMYSVYIAAACGYQTGKLNKMNTLLSSFVGIAAFLCISSLTMDGTINTNYYATSGLVVSMFSSIAGVELLTFLFNKGVGKFDLAQYGAPPALSDSFRILFPVAIVLTIFTFIGYGCLLIFGPLPELIGVVISPLVKVSDNIWFMMIAASCMGLFWWFGIHDGVINSMINPILSVMLLENIEQFAAGVADNALPYVGSRGLLWVFMLNYGILPLTIMCMFSKSKQIKTIGRASVIPALFSVGEPMVFGMPLCYNPYFFIPYLVVPALNVGIAYIVTSVGMMNRVVAYYTTTVPAPIHAFITTYDLRSVFLVLGLYILDAVIYYPFLKLYEKERLQAEAEAAAVVVEGVGK